TSVRTLDDQRLNLSPRRTLLAFLGCDAISVDGSVLIPAVLAGKPSDSACLAEAFLASHDDQRVPRRLVVVGESYKVASPAELVDTRTAAPLKPAWWLQFLHWLGLAGPFCGTPVNLYRIERGAAAIITDAGVHLAEGGGLIDLGAVPHYWRDRLAEPGLSGPSLPAVAETPGGHGGDALSRRVRVMGVIFDWNGVLALDEPFHFAAFAKVCAETAGHSLLYTEYAETCFGLTDQEGIRGLVASGWAIGDVPALV